MVDYAAGVEEPIDLILLSLKEKVYVKCRHNRELKGTLVVSLHLFQHLKHTIVTLGHE
jgi:small nuclear ribonucleoprotein (snRNP)-like protein